MRTYSAQQNLQSLWYCLCTVCQRSILHVWWDRDRRYLQHGRQRWSNNRRSI